MDRRAVLLAPGVWIASRALAQDDAARPRHKVSAGELHAALSRRFPVRFSLAGLLQLQVDAPQLLLLPPRQKLGATLVLQASGAQLQQLAPGEMDVVFAIRYERADRTLRASQPDVLALRWPGLAPDVQSVLQATLPGMARDAIGEFVLHRFTAAELDLPRTMGFEPGRIEVLEDGIMVLFVPIVPAR